MKTDESMNKIVWEYLRDHPKSTSCEMRAALKDVTTAVTSYLTDLYRRKSVTREKRTYYTDTTARKVHRYEYMVVGKHYKHRPLPAEYRKVSVAAAQATPDQDPPKVQVIEPVIWTAPAPQPEPAAAQDDPFEFVEDMTLRQIRALKARLAAVVGELT